MSGNPYSGLPDHQFWRRSVAGTERFRFDPVVSTRFAIGREDRVATAGSCFAQHIARRLANAGFRYYVTEAGEALPPAERESRQFGVFSARYGNLYTARQLLQLFQECFEGRQVAEPAWQREDGRWVDALRPQVEPDGFASPAEVQAAREEHLAATRTLFETCDVFVFTLGLTEAWASRVDGTIYPVAPGVVAGTHDPARHAFVNLGVHEVLADMQAFLAGLKSVNPQVRVVLTVSPVPLIATYESDRSALVATTYSKSVLRVVAEMLFREHAWVDYFPSFEIINGNYNNGAYFEADFRSIRPMGVDHVMRCFLRHYTDVGATPGAAPVLAVVPVDLDVVCDEEAIDQVRGQ